MNELLTWLALWLTPGALVFAWIRADEWLACPAEGESLSERNHRLDAEATAATQTGVVR